MKKGKTDPVFIEHILSLLNLHGKNDAIPDSRGAYIAQNILTFIDEMPGGFFIYHSDEEERLIYANQAVLRIFGCDTPEEFFQLTGNSFKGLVHPEDLEDVEKSIKSQIADSQYDLDYVEYRIIRRDGAIRWVEDYGHFIHNERIGDIFYVFISDATEKMEKINQVQTQRLRVIEGLSINYDSILYVDLDTDKVLPYRLNSRTEPAFGKRFQPLSYHQFIAEYLDTWIHPMDRETFARVMDPEYICQKLSEQNTYYINFRIVDGNEVQCLQLCLVNTDTNHHVSRIIVGSRRVDQEIQHEMEQKQMLEEALNNANLAIVAKNTFLSNMSHDMRTPLNAIFGFTSLAKAHINDEEALHGYLDKIETAGKHLLNLIEKVLDISWTESNDIHIAETECDLRHIIEDVESLVLPQAHQRNISVFTDTSRLIHNKVYTDPDKLKQVLLHLAGNAVTYTNTNGKIEITVTEPESFPNDNSVYQFRIKDTGIGISPEFLEHIFEPFEREKNTTFSGVYGTGLGLTIVKNIVDKMGGTIEAASRKGEGSTFTVTLQFRVRNQSASSGGEEDIIARLQDHTILLVEDNEINLEMESEILQDLGFITEIATDGSIAVEKIRQSSPGHYSLVLMDIQMPVMNGWEAAKAIRRLENPRLARIPIIALSADAFESNRQMSLQCGMDAHLTKPLDVAQLLETMDEAIRRHKNTKI